MSAEDIHNDLIESLDFLADEAQKNKQDNTLEHCGYNLMMITSQFLSGISMRDAESNLALILQIAKYHHDLLIAGTNDDKRLAKAGLGRTMQQLAETVRNLNPENEVVQRIENKMFLAINSVRNS